MERRRPVFPPAGPRPLSLHAGPTETECGPTRTRKGGRGRGRGAARLSEISARGQAPPRPGRSHLGTSKGTGGRDRSQSGTGLCGGGHQKDGPGGLGRPPRPRGSLHATPNLRGREG